MDKCPICFDDIDDKEVASTDVCDHLFCFSCLEKWAKRGSYCPVDRMRFKKIIKLNSDDVIQVKPRRRKKKNRVQYDVTAYCEYCKLTSSSATLLLCDSCDLAYHCACLTPPLNEVPAGSWDCPPCVAIDERLKRRNGTSKECEPEFKPRVENDPPTLVRSCAENNASHSGQLSMPKLSPWKKKNFEASINPCVSSDDELPNLDEKLNATKMSRNGTLRVVVEKLNIASFGLTSDSILKSEVPQSERPFRTESVLEQKSSTSTSEDVSAFKSEQELPTLLSSEESVTTENCLSEVDDSDKFPIQKYETNIVAVVPEKKTFQFSVFQKLEDIPLSELKYLELATSSNNPKINTPCDICKCWKIKKKTERLEKLLQKKKLHLNKHSANLRISRIKNPSKPNRGKSRSNNHVRNGLISEIQKIQQKKWKLRENYNLKKRHIIRQFKKQLKMISSNETKIQTGDLLSTMPSCSKNKLNIKKEPNSPGMTTHRDIEHSKFNFKSLNSSVLRDESSKMVKMSSDVLKACDKSTYDTTTGSKLANQAHSSKDFLNIDDKVVKSEKVDERLQKPFHLSDLERIVIRSDGSIYLDSPKNM